MLSKKTVLVLVKCSTTEVHIYATSQANSGLQAAFKGPVLYPCSWLLTAPPLVGQRQLKFIVYVIVFFLSSLIFDINPSAGTKSVCLFVTILRVKSFFLNFVS